MAGPPGPRSGGVVYTRWGRTTCPNTIGTELAYSGRAGGSYVTQQGGGANYLCMPDDPDYISASNGVQGHSPIHGAEYHTAGGALGHLASDHNVPCAVCHATTRSSTMMIPAKTQCPISWTQEYIGYLMSNYKGNHRGTFTCVDKDAEVVEGEAQNSQGVLFHHTEATCNGLQCPPYDEEKELTCVVCTK